MEIASPTRLQERRTSGIRSRIRRGISEKIQLAPIYEFAVTREAAAVTVLDSGDAQAFALAATRNGR